MPNRSPLPMLAFQDFLRRGSLAPTSTRFFLSAVRSALKSYGEDITDAQLAEHRAKLSPMYRPTFDTGWRHFCDFAKTNGADLPKIPDAIEDTWAAVYPVLFDHLWEVVLDCGIYPAELGNALLGDFSITTEGYEIRLRGRKRVALARVGTRKVCDDHLMPILDWAHPVRPADMDTPLISIRPGGDAPLGRGKILKILLALKGKKEREAMKTTR